MNKDSSASVQSLDWGEKDITVTVNGLGNLEKGTTYTLLTVTGTQTQESDPQNPEATPQFTLTQPGALVYEYKLGLNDAKTELTLAVDIIGGVHVWNGGAEDTWSTDKANQNWLVSKDEGATAPDNFDNGDKVLFESGEGEEAAVTVRGEVAPGDVTVAGMGDTTLQADADSNGTIAGETLTKLGTGTLTMEMANTFSKGTDIYEGTVAIHNAEALGGGAVTLYGGKLEVAKGSMTVTRADNATATSVLTKDEDLAGQTALTVTGNMSNSTLTATSGNIQAKDGVKNSNTLTAQKGDIEVMGDVQSYNTLTANEGDIEVTGEVQSHNTLTANEGNIKVTGEVQSHNTLTASGDISVAKTISGSGNTLTSTAGNISLSSLGKEATNTTISAKKGDVTLENACSLSADSRINAENLNLKEDTTLSGTVALRGNANIAAGKTLTMNAGSSLSLAEDQALTLVDGRSISIEAGGSLAADLTAEQGACVSLGAAETDVTPITGELTLDGATLTFSNAGSAGEVSVGSLAVTSESKVTVKGIGDLGVGSYTLLNYGAYALSENLSTPLTLTAAPSTHNYELTLNDKELTLAISVADGVHVWNGGTGDTWSTNEPDTNWLVGGTAGHFTDGDLVLIEGKEDDETAVTVSGTVAPGDFTVAGKGNTTLQADADSNGTITGKGKLTKIGTGSLIIDMANSFSGGTDIYEGAVDIRDAAALGTGEVTLCGGDLMVRMNLNNDIILQDGQLTLINAGTVASDITLTTSDADGAKRLISVEGSAQLTGTLDMQADGYIDLNDTDNAAANLRVGAFNGSGKLDISGKGDITFGTEVTEDATGHTGDIIVSGLAGTLRATALNSLGTEGAITFSAPGDIAMLALPTAPATPDALITADQSKDFVFNKETAVSATSGESAETVTLSGKVTGTGALNLIVGDLTLTGEGNDLAAASIYSGSKLTLKHEESDGAAYGDITNEGTLAAENASITTLTNNSADDTTSKVTGGSLGSISNQQGSMTVTGTTLAANAPITNGDGTDGGADAVPDATLTLNGVTQEAPLGKLTNNQDGELNIGKSDTSASELKVTEAELNGTVNVTGDSKLTTTDKMTVSGTTVLGDAAVEGDKGSLVSEDTAGMVISGSVTGTGDLISKDGAITVTGAIGTPAEEGTASTPLNGSIETDKLAVTGGTVNLSGNINTESVDVTDSGKVVITTKDGLNNVGTGTVSGTGSTLELEDGTYNSIGSTTTITAEKGGEIRLTNTTYNGNVQVSGKQDAVEGSVASTLTMTSSTVNGNVNFEGDNTFNIHGENHIHGQLNVSAGTVTSQNGSVEVHDTTQDGQPLEQALCVAGTYNINANASYTGAVDMKGGTLNIMSEKPKLVDVDVLTFTTGGTVNINTDGANVDIETVHLKSDGTININGAYGAADAELTLHMLTAAENASATLTLNEAEGATGTSSVVIDEKNKEFAGDIDLNADKLTVKEDDALGTAGTLYMKDGSTLAADATDEKLITLSKNIRSDKTANDGNTHEDGGSITIATADGNDELELKGKVDVDGEITKSGGGELTFSGSELTAEKVNLDDGSTIVLDGETADVDNFNITSGELEVTNNSTLEAATGDDNTITLNGTSTGDARLHVTDTELETGARLAVEGKGTIQTDMKTTLTDVVTGGEESTLEKKGAEDLVLAADNAGFKGTLVHTEGRIEATVADALGSGTVELNDAATQDSKPVVVELDAPAEDGKPANFSNDWNAQSDANLVATQEATLSGSFSGNGSTITKSGEMVTLTGTDAEGTTAASYTLKLDEAEKNNGITLSKAGLRGTLKAEAGQDIIVTGGGVSTVGKLELRGDHAAGVNTLNENATHVRVQNAGLGESADVLASATGETLDARGAQLIIEGWEKVNGTEVAPLAYADSTRLLVGKGISGFDKEMLHDLELRNVNLVEETDANGVTNSYAEVSINHKGADKNAFEQGVSDAITSQEGADGRMGELVAAMSHTGSEADSRAALNSIGGAGIATTMAAQMGSTHDHMRTLRGAIGQPSPRADWWDSKAERPQWVSPRPNLWTMATGATAELDEDGSGGAGYSRNDTGVLIGGDVTLGRTALVGLAMGYSRSKVDSPGHTITGDQYFVDVYARKNIGRFTQAATLGVGVHDWSVERMVHVKTGDLYADFNGKGEGQAKGMSVNFSYEAAYNFRFRERHVLSPLFTLECGLNQIDGYREEGTIGNAGLDVEFEDSLTTTLGLGARYAYEFDGFGTAQGKGYLSARAMVIADVGDVNGRMKARFISGGSGFDAESTENSNTGFLLGVDALVPVSRHWSLFGNAHVEIRDAYSDVAAGAGVKYSF